jgi:hypothetical protein
MGVLATTGGFQMAKKKLKKAKKLSGAKTLIGGGIITAYKE